MNFLSYFTLVIFLSFSLGTYAQQVQQESNSDLRKNSLKFSFESIKNKLRYELLESNGNFHLLLFKDSTETNRRKISLDSADSIEKEFVENFIKMKYSLPAHTGKKCNTLFKIEVRSELEAVCEGEKEKMTSAKYIQQNLENRLNKL